MFVPPPPVLSLLCPSLLPATAVPAQQIPATAVPAQQMWVREVEDEEDKENDYEEEEEEEEEENEKLSSVSSRTRSCRVTYFISPGDSPAPSFLLPSYTSDTP